MLTYEEKESKKRKKKRVWKMNFEYILHNNMNFNQGKCTEKKTYCY